MPTPKNLNIGLIGCGRMGGAIARGLLDNIPNLSLHVCDTFSPSVEALIDYATPSRAAQIQSFEVPSQAAQGCDAVILAVKPDGILPLLRSMVYSLPQQTLFISVAAGLNARALQGAAGHHPVLRAMPNTPSLVGEGVTAILLPEGMPPEYGELACQLLGALGEVIPVTKESLFDPITALSGSGPAFVALFAEALADAAVAEGLPRDIAAKLARLTIRGTATLLEHQSPGVLKDAVGSPGGTTMAGVCAAEEHGLRAATIAAVRAAARRSREMGEY